MENGIQHGVRSNHDRESLLNGISDKTQVPDEKSDKGKITSSQQTGGPLVNGVVGDGHPVKTNGPQAMAHGARSNPNRMNDLPDEVTHITQGFIPLSTILVRLAQATHDDLQKAVVDSANIKWMPAIINGNTPNGSDLPDDNSEGNRKRKTTLLRFAQDAHTKWVKALVITDWSRKADAVSKLIDLKAHLDGKRMIFDFTQNDLIGLKRDLGQARLPRPDLKTALQILTTGEASWIPEPGYITPPPLTPEDQIKWIEELNTLLSLRLNLDDYDKIPHQFKDYSIQSGRVTFKVKGEFEVDLTIADEDFEKQFWFIDFRFAFSPSTPKVDNRLMNVLEVRVNEVLGTDGLASCYSFLHEFVLTHKINELKRQANELARTSWTGNLKVEPLNRALAIQYWTNRYGPTAPKSWVMVAVQSGKQKGSLPDPRHPSRLVARWYRDNKEIKDAILDLDVDNLSAESLLNSAISRHIEHILSSIHEKLAAAPRFVRRETFMRLNISRKEPLDSSLKMQLGPKVNVTLAIEPVTGFAAVQPHTKYALQGETRLNHGGKDPAEDGIHCLENIRWGYVIEEFNRRGKSTGWAMTKNPVSNEEVKRIIKTRDQYHPVFFQRQGLGQDWFVMMSLSLSGDEWWLVQVNQVENTRSIGAHLDLQLTKGQPDLSDSFWNNLTTFAAGIISHYGEMGQLHRSSIRYQSREDTDRPLPRQVQVPALLLSLSDILTPPDATTRQPVVVRRPSWAENVVEIMYNGLRHDPSGETESGRHGTLGTAVVALVKVTDRSKFKKLPGKVDKDVSFNRRTGQFRFFMRGSVGRPILEQLAEHVRSIDRLVALLDAIRSARGSLKVVEVGLRRAKFTYPDVQQPNSSDEPRQWTAILDMSASKIRLVLEEDNPHLRLLDYLNKLANKERGLSLLMAYLVEVLPLLSALDLIDMKWADVDGEGKGQATIFPRGADWFAIRYEIHGANEQKRRLYLEVRSRSREGAAYWYVSRREGNVPDMEENEVDRILKKVFDNRGEDWRGLTVGAAAIQGTLGVRNMLVAIDEAIRTHAQGGDMAAVEAALKALPAPVHINETPSLSQLQPSQGQVPQDRRPSQSQGQTPQDRRPSQSQGQGQHARPNQPVRPPQGQRQNSSSKTASGTKDTPFVLD